MGAAFEGRGKSGLQSKKQRVIKGMAKKQIIREKTKYCFSDHFWFSGLNMGH
jgi:hypothetical protein